MPHYTSLRVERGQLHQEWPRKSTGERVDIAAEVKRDVWLLDAIHRAATGEWKICDFDQLAEGKINEFVGVLDKIRHAPVLRAIPGSTRRRPHART